METGLYETEDKTQRRRVIIVTSIIAIVVLCIAAWAIVAIVGSSDKNIESNTNKTEVATDDGAAAAEKATAEKTTAEKTEAKTEANTEVNTEVSTEESTEVSTEAKVEKTETEVAVANKEAETEKNTEVSYFTRTAEEVPETGPEELLPLALVIGAIVTFIGSCKLAERRV